MPSSENITQAFAVYNIVQISYIQYFKRRVHIVNESVLIVQFCSSSCFFVDYFSFLFIFFVIR